MEKGAHRVKSAARKFTPKVLLLFKGRKNALAHKLNQRTSSSVVTICAEKHDHPEMRLEASMENVSEKNSLK